jgi:hypothetical protein
MNEYSYIYEYLRLYRVFKKIELLNSCRGFHALQDSTVSTEIDGFNRVTRMKVHDTYCAKRSCGLCASSPST